MSWSNINVHGGDDAKAKPAHIGLKEINFDSTHMFGTRIIKKPSNLNCKLPISCIFAV